MTDEELLRGFESRTLPLARWDHRAHVKVAYLYLCRHGFDEAQRRMRSGLRAFIAAHGIVESPTTGYHETITWAWLRLVDATLAEYGPAATADAFCDEQSQLCEKKALRLFYSRARLASPEARASIVEPDLAPLPGAPSAAGRAPPGRPSRG